MKNKIIQTLALVVALFATTPTNLDAKGSSFRSSGGSFRSTPSRSFSAPKTPSIPKPSVSKPFSSPSKPSTVIPKAAASTPTGPKTAFDKSQAVRSVTPPTPPKPKDQYIADFKKNNASKYPTTFSTPPASRPSYIPPTTTYNGQSRPIEYNPQTRSYGFFDGLGQFMIYDAITDLALNQFKKDEVVYVQQVKEQETAQKAVQQQQVAEQKVKEDDGIGVLGFVLIILVMGGLFLAWMIFGQ